MVFIPWEKLKCPPIFMWSIKSSSSFSDSAPADRATSLSSSSMLGEWSYWAGVASWNCKGELQLIRASFAIGYVRMLWSVRLQYPYSGPSLPCVFFLELYSLDCVPFVLQTIRSLTTFGWRPSKWSSLLYRDRTGNYLDLIFRHLSTSIVPSYPSSLKDAAKHRCALSDIIFPYLAMRTSWSGNPSVRDMFVDSPASMIHLLITNDFGYVVNITDFITINMWQQGISSLSNNLQEHFNIVLPKLLL